MYPVMENWKHAGKALRNYKSNFRKLLLSMRRWQLLIKRDHHYRKQLSICLGKSGVVPEEMKTRYGLQCIRRSHADGHHYFISSLQEKGVNDWITLAVPAESVMLFNPMTGEKGKAQTRKQEGKTQVRLQLHSGESVILQTFNHALTDVAEWKYVQEQPVSLSLDHGWKLHFAKALPR